MNRIFFTRMPGLTISILVILCLFLKCGAPQKKDAKVNVGYSVDSTQAIGSGMATMKTSTDTGGYTRELKRVYPPVVRNWIRIQDKWTVNKSVPDTTTTAQQPEKNGVLGYSFFKEMKLTETKSIHAFISIHHSQSALRDTIRLINAAEEPDTKNDTVSIFTQNILLYKYVGIQLMDPDSSFVIVQVHNHARQEVDEVSGNHWQWEVTPRTTHQNVRLILKVVAEKPASPPEEFESRTIPITIHVNTHIFRNLWIYLYDHPKFVLAAIIIPLVAYFGRKIFDRRK